jgi:hypothetical protein
VNDPALPRSGSAQRAQPHRDGCAPTDSRAGASH